MTSVLNQGILATWKDDKGFGFIRPKNGGEDIFLHISELKDATRRPQEGDTIYYYVTTQDGKTRACNAFIAGARRKPNASAANGTKNGSGAYVLQKNPFPTVTASLLSIFPIASSIHFLFVTVNPLPLVLYPVMSIVTFYVYADDKRRAKANQRRIPESTLHTYEMLGGWIGRFAAQRCFRHKNKKESYQSAFWLIVVAHYMAWIGWFLWFLLASQSV